jgi:hypothetical protein
MWTRTDPNGLARLVSRASVADQQQAISQACDGWRTDVRHSRSHP